MKSITTLRSRPSPCPQVVGWDRQRQLRGPLACQHHTMQRLASSRPGLGPPHPLSCCVPLHVCAAVPLPLANPLVSQPPCPPCVPPALPSTPVPSPPTLPHYALPHLYRLETSLPGSPPLSPPPTLPHYHPPLPHLYRLGMSWSSSWDIPALKWVTPRSVCWL